MRTIETNFIATAAVAIALVAGHSNGLPCIWALGLILRYRSTDRARLVIARGFIFSFGIYGGSHADEHDRTAELGTGPHVLFRAAAARAAEAGI
jgi:hypothetical protein